MWSKKKKREKMKGGLTITLAFLLVLVKGSCPKGQPTHCPFFFLTKKKKKKKKKKPFGPPASALDLLMVFRTPKKSAASAASVHR